MNIFTKIALLKQARQIVSDDLARYHSAGGLGEILGLPILSDIGDRLGEKVYLGTLQKSPNFPVANVAVVGLNTPAGIKRVKSIVNHPNQQQFISLMPQHDQSRLSQLLAGKLNTPLYLTFGQLQDEKGNLEIKRITSHMGGDIHNVMGTVINPATMLRGNRERLRDRFNAIAREYGLSAPEAKILRQLEVGTSIPDAIIDYEKMDRSFDYDWLFHRHPDPSDRILLRQSGASPKSVLSSSRPNMSIPSNLTGPFFPHDDVTTVTPAFRMNPFTGKAEEEGFNLLISGKLGREIAAAKKINNNYDTLASGARRILRLLGKIK